MYLSVLIVLVFGCGPSTSGMGLSQPSSPIWGCFLSGVITAIASRQTTHRWSTRDDDSRRVA